MTAFNLPVVTSDNIEAEIRVYSLNLSLQMIIILNRFYFCESRSSSFAYDFFPPSCPQFPLVL